MLQIILSAGIYGICLREFKLILELDGVYPPFVWLCELFRGVRRLYFSHLLLSAPFLIL